MYNINRTKNEKVIWFVLLKLEINKHTKDIDVAVIDLNNTVYKMFKEIQDTTPRHFIQI